MSKIRPEHLTKTQADFINTIKREMFGLLNQVQTNDYYGTKQNLISKAGRAVGDALTVAGGKWSRLLTPAAYENLLKGNKNTTREHPHSKQQMGMKLVQTVLRKDKVPTEEEILKFLKLANVTIESLKTENNALSKHQNDPNIKDWKEAYQHIGINCLYYVPPHLYQYKTALKNNKIDDIITVSLDDADDILTQV